MGGRGSIAANDQSGMREYKKRDGPVVSPPVVCGPFPLARF